MWMVMGKASRQVTGDKLGELYRLLVWPSQHGGGSGHMPYPPHHLDRQWRVVPPLLVGARLSNTTDAQVVSGGAWIPEAEATRAGLHGHHTHQTADGVLELTLRLDVVTCSLELTLGRRLPVPSPQQHRMGYEESCQRGLPSFTGGSGYVLAPSR